ncbi:MAG: SPASM domain-containing protein [Deltaproteobacteria bacterium]|nr:SPASM domain-containing protein [Deltaproteobacteria bacterium]
MRKKLGRDNIFLSFENYKKIVDSGNFRYVGLHGWGEPLLNHDIFEMIKYAESKGISTNLTTNGTLIHEKIEHIFKSGLNEIAFGIYDKSLFFHILPKIEELINEKRRNNFARPKIYFDITIYKENFTQIKEFLDIAHDLGVDAVILHRLFNVYNVDPRIEYISEREEKELFAEVTEFSKFKRMELYLPSSHRLPCRYVKSSIFVTAYGNVTPCCFLPELYLGNAVEIGLKRIIRSKKYIEFVKGMSEHPVCSKCFW